MSESRTFHPFQLLPTELRLQIWNYSLPPPRLLNYILLTWLKGNASSFQAIPALLHVNAESRAVAQKHYAWYRDATFGRTACVAPKRDVVVLRKYPQRIGSPPKLFKLGGEEGEDEDLTFLEHEFTTLWIAEDNYWRWLKDPESKRNGTRVTLRPLKALQNFVVIYGSNEVSITEDPLVVLSRREEVLWLGKKEDGDVRAVNLEMWNLVPVPVLE